MIVALASLTYAIIEGRKAGWLSAEIVGVFASRWLASSRWSPTSCGADEPLLEVRFFRSAPFSGASAIAVCVFAGDRRVPVPEHPLPAERARPLAVPRGPVHAADGGR